MRHRAAILALALATALPAPSGASAQVSETAVKAAFIPKFARYVSWPASAAAANGPLVICIIGEDPFGRSLDQAAASQSVDGRPFVVKRFAAPAGASGCAIAFVDTNRTGEALASLGRQPVLTVTDARNSGDRGVIHFAVVGGRVRFFIDNAQAQARGLTISSRLLAIALGVNQR